MKTINKNDIKMPKENGWYVCKYERSSSTYYKDEENEIGRYDICNCALSLLYWEDNLWLRDPRGYEMVDNRYILEWYRLPDEFNVSDEKIKVVY